MKKLSLLLFLMCLGFKYCAAQQEENNKVEKTIQDSLKKIVSPPPKEEIVFRLAEEMPYFPGCKSAHSRAERKKCSRERVQEFIQGKIEYPVEALENGIEGSCLVSFRGERNGKVNEVELIKDIGGKCGQEALRVINLMVSETPYWIPPVGRIRRIDLKYIVPIRFELQHQSGNLLERRYKVENR